ncbi:hypothetical protein BDZ97DRAFT_1761100 [Flammula alnicola]|nr:hypothetical protein BDZ97DRAFT_1761100 [Flammula alnicola]
MSGDQTNSRSATYTRDDDYYLQSTIFLVEDRLFKVPILPFTRESDVFQAMFELPQDPNVAQDGSIDEQPIRLEGVKKEDFKRLLNVMYARWFVEEENFSQEDWTSVLALSDRWEMEHLRKLAIDKLTSSLATDAHKLVIMGQKYNIKSWLMSGIHLLVIREAPMDDEDANNIGMIAALKTAAIREWTFQYLARIMMPPAETRIMLKIRESFGLGEGD